jgi:hypothetical protein
MRISLETSSPPPSRGRFQLRPQSSRSRVPLAVKRPGGRPWGGVAEVFGLQADRPGDAADGELSRQDAAGALPAGGAAGEGGCGWWRVVSKEVRVAKILIAGLAAGVDRGHVDGDLGSGPTGCLRLPGSLQTREPAADLGQHEMAAGEGHPSVAGVDLLLAGSRKLGPAGRGRWHGRAPIPHGHPPAEPMEAIEAPNRRPASRQSGHSRRAWLLLGPGVSLVRVHCRRRPADRFGDHNRVRAGLAGSSGQLAPTPGAHVAQPLTQEAEGGEEPAGEQKLGQPCGERAAPLGVLHADPEAFLAAGSCPQPRVLTATMAEPQPGEVHRPITGIPTAGSSLSGRPDQRR